MMNSSSGAAGGMPLPKGMVKERETTPSVSSVYVHVIDSVIKSLRSEFQKDNVDDSVLNEVQTLWELKMMQNGALTAPIERNSIPRPANGPPITPVHDLNVPYEATEEYQTPTADILFPPTPAIETPIQTPLPGTSETMMYQYLPPPVSHGQPNNTYVNDSTIDVEGKIGRPTPYMNQPTSWMSHKPVALDVNVAYEEDGEDAAGGINQPVTKDFFTLNSGKRKRDDQPYVQEGYIPQQDGAADLPMGLGGSNKVTADETTHASDAAIARLVKAKLGSSKIPQTDGADDLGKASLEDSESADQDEEPLNDNDDDPDDADQINGDAKTDDFVLAQFEKVSRTKNRWKCTLKDGIMHLNSKDILFSKATGEFDF